MGMASKCKQIILGNNFTKTNTVPKYVMDLLH